MTEVVKVGLADRSYEVRIGPGLLADAGAPIAPLLKRRRVFVVTDERVAELHLPTLRRSLEAEGIEAHAVVLPPGEATKSFAHLERLCEALLERNLERSDVVVALGGGVIGDLAGFAAAILLRGIDFVQIPTTLLAQVDSSVGGKTGIDSRHGKNLVGAFHQPRLVLADTGVLDTLPRREVLAGYAEVVKYGLLGDAAFFAWLEAHGVAVVDGDAAARTEAIRRSCEAKARIVAADEREGGVRALLNLGHTFGHALEAETGFGGSLLHGEAVAIGMVMAFDLSVRLGLCPAGDAVRVRRHLADVGLPTDPRGLREVRSVERLLAHMAKDKKVSGGRLTFVLVHGIGDAFVTRDVDAGDVAAVLSDSLAQHA